MRNIEFRGFISFSHKDESISLKLFNKLEAFQVPKKLQIHNVGEAKLGVFFRDREELAVNTQLSAHLRDALARSKCLIVICSLNSVESSWVEKEIKAYRELRPGGEIFPVIVGGAPPDCFPASLRTLDLVAADLRPQADGEENGFLKLVAGILGIGFGDLKDRVAEADRLRLKRTRLVAMTFGILTFFSIASMSIAFYFSDRANDLASAAINVSGDISEEAMTIAINSAASMGAVKGILDFSLKQLDSLRRFDLKEDELSARIAWTKTRFAQLNLMTENYDSALDWAERAANMIRNRADYNAMLGFNAALLAKAQALLGLDQNIKGLEVAWEAMTYANNLSEKHPEKNIHKTQLLISENLRLLGNAQAKNKQNDNALESFSESAKILISLNKELPSTDDFYPMLIAENYESMGDIARETNDYIRALTWYNESVEYQELFLQSVKGQITTHQNVLEIALKGAEVALILGKKEQAIQVMESAVRAMSLLDALMPDEPAILYNLKRANLFLSQIRSGQNPFIKEDNKKSNLDVEKNEALRLKAVKHKNLGEEFADRGQFKDSISEFLKSIDIFRRLIRNGNEEASVRIMFAEATLLGGASAIENGDSKMALKLFQESRDSWRILESQFGDIQKYKENAELADYLINTHEVDQNLN